MKLDLTFDSAVVINEPCYFCNEGQLIGFNEHYIFCSNCSAIYTNMIIHEKECDHVVKDRTPVAIREPWFESARNGRVYLTEAIGQPGITHNCSICFGQVIADGW
jgi:hypothetical protein